LSTGGFSKHHPQDCMSAMSKRCMHKSEVGFYGIFMNGGNPCFVYNDGRWCFVTAGLLHPCTCTEECGCEGVSTVVSCPAKQVPKTPDCTADQDKYCSLGPDNTMCKYCGVNKRESCFKAFCHHGLTQIETDLILNKHNELRAKVANGQQIGQPSAANMKKLKWSTELAKIAQRWADQCPSYHDTNRMSPDFLYEPGQNMANSWSSLHNSFEWNLEAKIQRWFDEVTDFPAANIESFSTNSTNATIGHYTQLVWGNTEFIGCGAIYYKENYANTSRYPFRQTLICNYHPPGNYLGKPVYIIGEPGSACTNDVSTGNKNDDGLCP